MNTNINLDKFKPFFKSVIKKLDYGIGFNLYINPIDHTDLKLQASLGGDKPLVYYNSVVKIITNPNKNLKDIEYNPPQDMEYLMSIMNYIKGTQVTILIEEKGFWLYSPNTNLINVINNLQPNLVELEEELKEGELGLDFKYNDEINDLFQVISNNVETYNVYLSYTKELAKIDYPEISKHFDKINLKEYSLYMNNVLNDEDYPIGFNVEFVPWEDSLNFFIYFNEVSNSILKNIKKRGMNEWNENDVDLFIKTAKKAKELTIIRKK
jgi:hypothetical protein